MKISLSKKRLLGNAVSLYAVQGSAHLLSLVTVPYLTRVLGPAVYGKVGVTLAYMTYAAVFLDFGFTLSATQKAAENRGDSKYLSGLVSAVTIAKLCLALVLACVFAIIHLFGALEKSDSGFYLSYMAAYAIQSLFPDYLYRGVEDMKAITMRVVGIRSLSAILTLIFVGAREDYRLIPLFLLAGNLAALPAVLLDIKKRAVRLVRVGACDVITLLKDSLPFFISRISSTAYHALGAIVAGAVYGSSGVVGHYTAAAKLVSLAGAGASPIADSVYPYMIKNRDYRLIKWLLLAAMPLITLGSALLWIYAAPLCRLLFGPEYAEAGNMLRCLLPAMWAVFPSYLLAFPVLVPLGLSGHANFSNVIGMILQLLLLGALFLSGSFTIYSLCIVTSVTECAVLLYRLSAFLLFRKKTSRKKAKA